MARKTDPLLTLPDSEGLLYVRIYQKMRALILDGSWPRGMRMPSSRQLALDLGVSRNTVNLAFDQLIADGWVETRSRSGAFVSASVHAVLTPQPATGTHRPGRPPIPFELSAGAIDSFPFKQWARLQTKVWARSVPHLLYEHDRAGDLGLRRAIASVVGPAMGLQLDADALIIVTGTQGTLDLAASALGAGTAVVEDPGYVPAHALLKARGMAVAPMAVDDEGLDVAAARANVAEPALILTTPRLQFPTCVTMSAARRQALMDWADDSGAWIVEDDYDSAARFDGSAVPAPLRDMAPHRVISNVTLNRLLFRSLRLGFLIAPQVYRDRMLAARSATDEYVNLPNQLVLREFIEDGSFTAHVRSCRSLHAERREALIDALSPYLGSIFERELNHAGLHLVLRPIGHSEAAIADALREQGIACTTLGDVSARPDARQGVLLGFAAFAPDVIQAMKPALDAALSSLGPARR